jgi:hypothetical protein
MGKVTFVAMMYVMGLCGLFIGGTELFQNAQFSLAAESAVMKSSDSVLLKVAKFSPGDSTRADVVYETPAGPIVVKGKFLTGRLVQALANGEGIQLKFLTSDPHRVLYEGDDLPLGLGWLIVGSLAFGGAVFAHRLLRREATGS